MPKTIVILFAVFILPFLCHSQTPSLTTLYTGVDKPTHIVSNDFDSGIYITELTGKILYIPDLDKDSLSIIGTIPNVLDTSFTGLYGMVFHPNYPDSPYIYVHYTFDTTYFESRLSRFNMQNGTLNTASERVIFRHDNLGSFHHGGNPIFGTDGYLYLSKGDGESNNAAKVNGQDPGNVYGTVLRVDVGSDDFPGDNFKNYGIPKTNPFARNNAIASEIYAFGFRNPWRISQDLITNDIYVGDVGLHKFEEINLLSPGENYGWACYEGTWRDTTYSCYSEVLTDPVFAGPHDDFESLTGGHVYRGSKYPTWQGKYFFADWSNGKFCHMTGDVAQCWDTPSSLWNKNISTFGQDRNGELYVADYFTGEISRLDTTFVDCMAIPDSLHLLTIDLPAYLANDYINIQAITNNSTVINSPVVEMTPITSLASGTTLEVISYSCADSKNGKTY